ncbi:MAG: alpha-ketoglutarate-dependent dioxygenase AlkB family protein [Geminicoccales bacterium]
MSRAISFSSPADRVNPRADRLGANAAREALNLLPIDGEAFLVDQALSPDIADQAFADLLETIDWRQETAALFGRKIPLPRLTAWYGDGGYAYSGIRHEPAPMTPALLALKSEAEALSGQGFNSVLINLYRDGRDSMGWHSDDEPVLGDEPIIASLSLGATRRFQLKHRHADERVSLDLAHGSCLVMQGRCQACWRHQLPKTKKQVLPRINLTFRRLQSS